MELTLLRILVLVTLSWCMPIQLNAGPQDIPFIVDCMESHRDSPPTGEWDYANMREAKQEIINDNHIFIFGQLGWHLTWGILFQFEDGLTLAYETRGSMGDLPGAFGRMNVPDTIIETFDKCGVRWSGLWPKSWPLQNGGYADVNEPNDPLSDLSGSELLPPTRE